MKNLLATAALAMGLGLAQPAFAQDTTGYADVDGLRMYYEIHGEGEPLVLLHGAYMSIRTFGELVPLFAANRQVIAVELQGHGRTNDIDRPMTYEALADDVAALMEQIGVEKADVFGYSLGGTTALQFAIRHPEKVDKLVAASAATSDTGFQPELKQLLPTMTPEMFEGPVTEEYRALSPHPDQFPELMRKLVELDMTPYAFPAEQVAGIRAPTLLLFGDADAVTPEHQIEMFRAMGGGLNGDMIGIPDVQLAVMPGTTHLGLMFNPQGVHALAETFLSTEAKAPFAP